MPLIMRSLRFAESALRVVPETSCAGASRGSGVSVLLVVWEGVAGVVLFDRTSVDPFIGSSSLNEGESVNSSGVRDGSRAEEIATSVPR
jgi:hypothetical protein